MTSYYSDMDAGELRQPCRTPFNELEDINLWNDDIVQTQQAMGDILADDDSYWSCLTLSDLHLSYAGPDLASRFTHTVPENICHSLQDYDQPPAFSLDPAADQSARHAWASIIMYSLQRHTIGALRTHKAPPRYRERRFECTTCSRVFHFPKDLRRHEATHSRDRPFKCPDSTCRYHSHGFSRKDNRSRHVRRAHPDISDAPALSAVSAHESLRFPKHMQSVKKHGSYQDRWSERS